MHSLWEAHPVQMPYEGRPPYGSRFGSRSWIQSSAFHTVTDILTSANHGRGHDARGIYADFSNQYATRTSSQIYLSQLSKCMLLFELYASGDGMVMETGATYVSTDGLQIYHEASTSRFYAATSAAGGTFCQKYCTIPAVSTWHSYAILLDRGSGGTGQVNSVYVDGVSQTLTNNVVTGGGGSTFVAATLNLMSRNAGASLKLTGRLKNFHVVADWWPESDIREFVNNPYSVFAPDPLFDVNVVAAAGAGNQSQWWYAAD